MTALLALLLAAPLTLRFDDADVREILAEVRAQAEVKIALDDALRGKKISLDVEEWQLIEVLDEIATRVGGTVLRERDGTYRILPAWKHTLLERLRKTKVKLHLDDATPLRSVLQTFRELTGVPVVLDPGRREEWPEMELHADDVTGTQFLDLALAPHELKWDLRYGVVFVSTRQRLEELPPRLDLPGVPDKRIGLDLEEVAWPKTAQVLAFMAGLKVEGDLPKEGTVTLHVPSIEVRHALELLFVPYGLDVEVKNRTVILRKRIPPTPYPEDSPKLKAEAEALDRARTLEPGQQLDAAFKEATARIQAALDRKDARRSWYFVYMAEWYALHGKPRADLEAHIVEVLDQALETIAGFEVRPGETDASRLVEAARTARERLEAVSK